MALKATIEDELPRIALSARGTLPPVERVRLLRPGAELPDVSSTVRARLALARAAAQRSGVQLISRSSGDRVVLELVFEPLASSTATAAPLRSAS